MTPLGFRTHDFVYFQASKNTMKHPWNCNLSSGQFIPLFTWKIHVTKTIHQRKKIEEREKKILSKKVHLQSVFH